MEPLTSQNGPPAGPSTGSKIGPPQGLATSAQGGCARSGEIGVSPGQGAGASRRERAERGAQRMFGNQRRGLGQLGRASSGEVLVAQRPPPGLYERSRLPQGCGGRLRWSRASLLCVRGHERSGNDLGRPSVGGLPSPKQRRRRPGRRADKYSGRVTRRARPARRRGAAPHPHGANGLAKMTTEPTGTSRPDSPQEHGRRRPRCGPVAVESSGADAGVGATRRHAHRVTACRTGRPLPKCGPARRTSDTWPLPSVRPTASSSSLERNEGATPEPSRWSSATHRWLATAPSSRSCSDRGCDLLGQRCAPWRPKAWTMAHSRSKLGCSTRGTDSVAA